MGWKIDGKPTIFGNIQLQRFFHGSRLVSFSDPLAAQVPNGKDDASDAQKATNSAWWMVKPRADRFFSRAITPKSGPKINGSNWVFVHPYNWSYGPLVISGRGPTLNKGWWTAYSMGLVDLGLVRHEMQNDLQM